MDRLEKIITIEALVGSFAIMRRIESGEMSIDNVPKPLREVYKQVMVRSPQKLKVDASFTLAPLLEYFINTYEPPKQISSTIIGLSSNIRDEGVEQ